MFVLRLLLLLLLFGGIEFWAAQRFWFALHAAPPSSDSLGWVELFLGQREVGTDVDGIATSKVSAGDFKFSNAVLQNFSGTHSL